MSIELRAGAALSVGVALAWDGLGRARPALPGEAVVGLALEAVSVGAAAEVGTRAGEAYDALAGAAVTQGVEVMPSPDGTGRLVEVTSGLPGCGVALSGAGGAGERFRLLLHPHGSEGAFRAVGTTTLASLAAGANSGTAGAGTTATSLAKPTAAANWTANDLVGRWLKVTGGGGYDAAKPTLRPILANTTTALSVSAVSGMNGTTTFEVVSLEEASPALTASLAKRFGVVELFGYRFSDATAVNLVGLADCREALISGCAFDANTAGPSLSVQRSHLVTVEHCSLSNSADVDVSRCFDVVLLGLYSNAGGVVRVSDSLRVSATEFVAVGAASNALRLERVLSAQASMDASTGQATALYLEDVQKFESVGTHCVGSGNTGHGVEVRGSGAITLTGCTVSGTSGDVNFFGRTVTWAILSGTDYGIVEEHAGNARARASYTKAIKYGSYLFDGNIDVSGRLLLYGYLNTAVPLTAQTATGTNAATALDMNVVPALGGIEVGTTPAGTGVRLPSGAAVAGVIVWVVNRGANTLNVYAPASGTVDGGASVTVAAGKAKGFMSLAGGLAFWTVAQT